MDLVFLGKDSMHLICQSLRRNLTRLLESSLSSRVRLLRKKLIRSSRTWLKSWDFRVRKMTHQEYTVVFPDKASLDTFTKLKEFEMSLFGLKGRLKKSGIDPETSSVLHTVWIKILNVPGWLGMWSQSKRLLTWLLSHWW
jgi:hypothetical protein